MRQYKIEIMKPARKFIESRTKEQQGRILRAIYKLPHSGDIKLLEGGNVLYRLKVGSYRVLYTVDNDVLTVRVTNTGNRGDIYKKRG